MKKFGSIQKGKKYENFIAECIEGAGLGQATREIGSGSGRLKGDIRSSIPFLIEAKHHKNVPLWLLTKIYQAKSQAEKGSVWPSKWALVFRDSRMKRNAIGQIIEADDYAVIDFHQFLELLKKNREPIIKEPDRQTSYKIRNLIQSAKQLLKELETE